MIFFQTARVISFSMFAHFNKTSDRIYWFLDVSETEALLITTEQMKHTNKILLTRVGHCKTEQ